MNIILDTNILVSASIFGGISSEILEICILSHNLIISEDILIEFDRTLKEKLKVKRVKIDTALKFFRSNFQLLKPINAIPNICRDEKDNHILQLTEIFGKFKKGQYSLEVVS